MMPFPWLEHRTMAEVAETAKLRRISRELPLLLLIKLEALMLKERAHNPPPEADPRSRA
jgi:hypothetical protein